MAKRDLAQLKIWAVAVCEVAGALEIGPKGKHQKVGTMYSAEVAMTLEGPCAFRHGYLMNEVQVDESNVSGLHGWVQRDREGQEAQAWMLTGALSTRDRAFTRAA